MLPKPKKMFSLKRTNRRWPLNTFSTMKSEAFWKEKLQNPFQATTRLTQFSGNSFPLVRFLNFFGKQHCEGKWKCICTILHLTNNSSFGCFCLTFFDKRVSRNPLFSNAIHSITPNTFWSFSSWHLRITCFIKSNNSRTSYKTLELTFLKLNGSESRYLKNKNYGAQNPISPWAVLLLSHCF